MVAPEVEVHPVLGSILDSVRFRRSSGFYFFLFPLFLRVHFFMDDFFGKGAWDLRIMRGISDIPHSASHHGGQQSPGSPWFSSAGKWCASEGHWPTAPLPHWRNRKWPTGPLAHWPTGPLAHWPTGPLAHWPTGPLAHWPTGPLPILAHWPTGPLPGENGVRSRGATVSSPGFLPSPGGEMVSSPGFLPSPPCLRGRSFHFTQVVTPRRLVVVLKGSHHGGQQSPGSPWFSSGHTAAASSLPAAVVLKWSPHHGDQQSPGSSWFSSGEGGVNATAASSLPARRGS